jgi:CubicO group peptidase (beta-lactamase class C family)
MQDILLRSRCLVLLAVACATAAVGGLAAPVNDHPTHTMLAGELGRRLDDYLNHAADWGFSGAVLVAKDNQIALAKGYGFANRQRKIAFTADTPSCIGSITKQFTAAAVLKLEMEGKLATSDPIAKHLPGVPADKSSVTIYHLLTHTGGFPEYSGDDYDKSPRDETIRRILATPLASKPGQQFGYSNAGYSTLAAIVERVSGQSYESYLHDRLFRPARMQNTGYCIPQWDKETLPHSYMGAIDHGTSLDHSWSPQGPYWNLFGNGGILSTVGDLYRWQQALQGDTVLSAAARKKLFTPVAQNYACGWDVRPTTHGRRIGHGGANDLGFNAVLGWFEGGAATLIVLCNSGTHGGYGGEMSGAISLRLTELVFGGSLPTFPRSAGFSIPPATLKRYEGRYQLPAGATVQVVLRDGQLVIEPIGHEAVALLALRKEEVDRFAALNQRADLVVGGILRHDFGLLEEAARNAAAGKLFHEHVEKRLRGWEKSDGPVQRAAVLGTVASWWDGQGTPVSFVQIALKSRSRIFRLHWQDGKVAGIGGAAIDNPAATPLQATGPREFIGWHLSIAKPVAVRFDPAADGQVPTLTLGVEGREVKARKQKNDG